MPKGQSSKPKCHLEPRSIISPASPPHNAWRRLPSPHRAYQRCPRLGAALVQPVETTAFDACRHPFFVDSSNLPLINDLRLVNDGVVVFSPIERIPPFDAVLSALFAEEEGHHLPTHRFWNWPPPNSWRRRFLGRDRLLQLANIAVDEEPADHGRRYLPPALCIELVGAREIEPSIGPRHLRFHAGVKMGVGLNHYYAGEAAVPDLRAFEFIRDVRDALNAMLAAA
jgi:hypothetical protein